MTKEKSKTRATAKTVQGKKSGKLEKLARYNMPAIRLSDGSTLTTHRLANVKMGRISIERTVRGKTRPIKRWAALHPVTGAALVSMNTIPLSAVAIDTALERGLGVPRNGFELMSYGRKSEKLDTAREELNRLGKGTEDYDLAKHLSISAERVGEMALKEGDRVKDGSMVLYEIADGVTAEEREGKTGRYTLFSFEGLKLFELSHYAIGETEAQKRYLNGVSGDYGVEALAIAEKALRSSQRKLESAVALVERLTLDVKKAELVVADLK